MELHQLRYALEVSRRGSFTAAADAIHVSQPGVSAQVAKLERELGLRLFERGSRTATLTSEGGVLVPHIATALAAVDRIRVVADDLVGIARGEVRIGTIIGCTIPGYLAAFAEFRQAHPGVVVTASEGNSVDLIAALGSGSLDVALVAHTESLPEAFDVHTVVDEPLAVGVPAGHPWATRGSIMPQELVDHHVLTLPSGTGVRSALEKTCAAIGAELTPAVQVYSPDAALVLAAQGAGVVVLSASMISSPLVTVGIRGSEHTCLSLATRDEPGAAARAFAKILRTRLDDPR
ncbi:putative LysR family transcriptional regulator [Gordonia effusa NBRC 100432]|uniref:Putative LysR family transcriptional regulator n=1 Tax=Gordonia effusa NBRC 100432 TaxID=1077974 RepID=H0QYZ1_9ACTN|nr:LysR family transcriptional regulator [Gordonia effusa]GAB18042.1 putative LysR family transcriptional regulator [Gordonia effusa NBRC 100432]